MVEICHLQTSALVESSMLPSDAPRTRRLAGAGVGCLFVIACECLRLLVVVASYDRQESIKSALLTEPPAVRERRKSKPTPKQIKCLLRIANCTMIGHFSAFEFELVALFLTLPLENGW